MSEVIRVIYKRFDNTTVHRGKKHTFLRIDMGLKNDGTVELVMEDYITESIYAFGEKIVRCPPTPATGSLFDVEDS